PLRQVLRHLGVAAQRAFLVAQRGDHHARPEFRAVLAQAPALVFLAPLFARDGELVPGLAGLDVRGLVEGRKVPAEDFARLVALDAARARVPARDDAFRAEH